MVPIRVELIRKRSTPRSTRRVIDDALKELVVSGADSPEIKRTAVEHGMRTLRQSALRKLAEGVTTFEEVVRVTGI